MLCDLVGSTGLLRTCQPEDLRAIIGGRDRKIGKLLLGNASNAGAEWESLLETALAIVAQGQDARQLELRAALDIASIWRGQGRHTETHDLHAPTHTQRFRKRKRCLILRCEMLATIKRKMLLA